MHITLRIWTDQQRIPHNQLLIFLQFCWFQLCKLLQRSLLCKVHKAKDDTLVPYPRLFKKHVFGVRPQIQPCYLITQWPCADPLSSLSCTWSPFCKMLGRPPSTWGCWGSSEMTAQQSVWGTVDTSMYGDDMCTHNPLYSTDLGVGGLVFPSGKALGEMWLL